MNNKQEEMEETNMKMIKAIVQTGKIRGCARCTACRRFCSSNQNERAWTWKTERFKSR